MDAITPFQHLPRMHLKPPPELMQSDFSPSWMLLGCIYTQLFLRVESYPIFPDAWSVNGVRRTHFSQFLFVPSLTKTQTNWRNTLHNKLHSAHGSEVNISKHNCLTGEYSNHFQTALLRKEMTFLLEFTPGRTDKLFPEVFIYTKEVLSYLQMGEAEM